MTYSIYDNTIDTDIQSVVIYDEIVGRDVKYKLYPTNKGWYINYHGKREYILVECE
jgi:hypothetical protein